MTPILGVHIKKEPIFLFCFVLFCFFVFLSPYRMTPFFNEILHRIPPTFFSGRHLYATFIFRCPPGVCMTEWHVWFKSFKSVTWLYCGTIMGQFNIYEMNVHCLIFFFLLMFLFVFVLNIWHAFFNTKFMCNHALCLLSVSLAFSVHVTQ